MSDFSRWVCLAVVGVLALSVSAAPPARISYQGRLTDGSGTPVADGNYLVMFTIYDASVNGSSKWSETQTVTTKRGLFSVVLGSVVPLSDTVFASTRYLGLRVGVNAEMTPRTMIVAVPYALRTATVDGAGGGTITGKVSIGSGHTNSGVDAFVAGNSNSASGPQSSIGGGRFNEVKGASSVVAGGEANYAPGSYSVISGGVNNQTDGRSSFIGGGDTNRVFFFGNAGTIAGGRQNEVSDTAGTVGGGANNRATGKYSVVAGGGGPAAADSNSASGDWATVGGGYRNRASGKWSVVAGGGGLAWTENVASGFCATVSGGVDNVASGDGATVPGGGSNLASGVNSFAAGTGARALHHRTFVWNGSLDPDSSTDVNQFVVVAAGGAFFKQDPVTITEDAGTNRAVKIGERYRDNGIVAWGKVSGSGTVGEEFGVSSVVRNNPGNYSIFLDVAAAQSGTLIPVANAEIDAAPGSAATVRIVAINQIGTTEFRVYITNGSFAPTDNDFVFIVTAR